MSSGAMHFPRPECSGLKDSLSQKSSTLQAARLNKSNFHVDLETFRRCFEEAAGDLPGGLLPPLDVDLSAAAAHAVRAGRFELASAVLERRRPAEAAGAPQSARSFVMRERPSARYTSGRRSEHRGPPLPTAPWLACSVGAVLQYARSTVVREAERGYVGCSVVLTGSRRRAQEAGSPQPAQKTSDGTRALRLRRRWPGAFAVGPVVSPRLGGGLHFQVLVELRQASKEHFRDRTAEVFASLQRPLLHIGFTARPPVDGGAPAAQDVADALDEDFLHDDCWLISMDGHVFEGSQCRCSIELAWSGALHAALLGEPPAAGLPQTLRRLCLGLSLEASGALRLDCGGMELGRTPAALVPRRFLSGAVSLHPLVVLGPNIERITLLAGD